MAMNTPTETPAVIGVEPVPGRVILFPEEKLETGELIIKTRALKKYLVNGSLIKGSGYKVYTISGNEKFWIENPTVFNGLGYKWNWIKTIDDTLLNEYIEGSSISTIKKHPNGTLIKYSYVESRQFYCTFYERLVKEMKEFKRLKKMIKSGINIIICGYDANEKLNKNNIKEWYLNSKFPFGHESVLFTMLICKEKEYPWKKYKTEEFKKFFYLKLFLLFF